MRINMALRAFILLIVLIAFCVMLGFVSGFLTSARIFYDKGQFDMLNRFLQDDFSDHGGVDILPYDTRDIRKFTM